MSRSISVLAAFALVSYSSAEDIQGTIRIWGSGQMQTLIDTWGSQFTAMFPGDRVEAKLLGTETAMAGLYTGVSDLAVMGRRATLKEIMAFEWVFKYKPLEIAIVTGSLNVPGKSPALVVFVHRDNPISQLTLAEVDAIFSCERLRGHAAIKRWGELGVRGNWAERRINAYLFNTETGSASFFKRVVMNGSSKWNWPQVYELNDAKQVPQRLAQDPSGIAVSSLCYANPNVKAVALSPDRDGRFYVPTVESVVAQSYPLTRLAYAYVNRPPGRPIPALVRQFLEYALSNAGQQQVAGGGYLPLNAKCLEEQREKMR